MANNFEHLSDNEFKDLKKVFYTQAYEIVDDLQDSVLRLETNSKDDNTVKAIKRYIHTLKGDSNSFGLTSIGTLCHKIEDVLSSLMDGSGHVEHEAVDLLLSCADTINRLLIESESGDNRVQSSELGVIGPEHRTDIKEIMGRIDSSLGQNKAKEEGRRTGDDGQGTIISRNYTEYQKLQIEDSLKKGLNIFDIEIVFDPMCGDKGVGALMLSRQLGNAGEIIQSVPDIENGDFSGADKIKILLSTKLDCEQIKRHAFITGITSEVNIRDFQSDECRLRNMELEKSKIRSASGGPKSEIQTSSHRSEMLRVEASKVDKIINLIGELIIGRSMIEQLARDIENGIPTVDISERIFAANAYMERTVSDLQKGAMKMRMIPINNVFRRFPKIVRDISLEKGNRVRLDIQGEKTELDKSIVDAIGEPLSHIIRNSIDHGIEMPGQRKSSGKAEEGVLTLKAYHEASQIVIEVSDDGRGLDIDKIKRKAIERGFINMEDAGRLSDRESLNLIFLSGLSTADAVSEISGRGVGMDAVKSAIEAMKGTIEVESTPGKGTKFILRLPLTLAVIKALLFSVGRKLYAIPVSVIAEVARVSLNNLITVDGRETLMLRDKIISIINLHKLFGVYPEDSDNKLLNCKKFALILGIGSRNIGVLVDHLIGQQELVIKTIEGSHSQSALIAGASILGDGKVVIILDALAIFKKAIEDEKSKAGEWVKR
jgi:two-component system chemotaxis sensor kinase CheA